MKPTIHRITDVPAYLDLLRNAREQGLQVRVGEGGAALVVGDWADLSRAGPGLPDQEAVSRRLNDLVREQLWSGFYGTATGPARSLAGREARLAETAGSPRPAGPTNWGEQGSGERWRQLQGEAYRQLVGLSPGFATELSRDLRALAEVASHVGLKGVTAFVLEAGGYLERADLPMHERLRLMAEAVLPLINEFGYLGDVAGGAMAVRFREAMQKLAQALMLAAGPLEDQRQGDADSRQRLAQLQAQGVERQRTDRLQQVGRTEAMRLMATLEGRQVLEQHLNNAIQAAKAAIREGDPDAGEDARRVHGGLGQAQDRLLTQRQGEMDAARWRDAMALAEDHRQALEAREQPAQRAAGQAESPVKALFHHLGELRQLLRERLGGERPDDPAGRERSPASRGPLERDAGSGPASEAVPAADIARAAPTAHPDLASQAQAMSRALDEALPAMVGFAARSGQLAASPGDPGGPGGPGDGDRIRALMAAYASALSEIAYIHLDDSRQRLRAACHHIVPHLGAMDTLLSAAAAADDFETVEKLFRLRKCLMVAHGDVQPPYLSFQAVPPPPELFREIGRAMAAAAMGTTGAASGSSTMLPSQRSVRELMAEAGAIIEKTVRDLLDLLRQASGSSLAARALGPVLGLTLKRLQAVSGDDGLTGVGSADARLRFVHALLKAIEAELSFAEGSSTHAVESRLLRQLIEAIGRVDALMAPRPAPVSNP